MADVRGDEWYTPRAMVEALGEFDLDPAAPSKNHWTAKTCYTKRDNGLTKPWAGRVFMNPPYSDIDPWIEKMTHHRNGIVLVFARMGTAWMCHASGIADAIFFLDGRIKFVDKKERAAGSANAPSMLLAYGEQNVEAIARAVVDGKLSGRLFEEVIPYDLLPDTLDPRAGEPMTEEEVNRAAEVAAGMNQEFFPGKRTKKKAA